MKILLPVDGSPGALAAVVYALQWKALGLRCSFVLVNVQEPASLYEMAVTHDAEKLEALRTAAGVDLLATPEALLRGAGVDYECEVAGGEPGNVLIELAENYGCSAIVMGSRGVGSPDALDLGSVAHAVLLHSSLPVMVVRRPQAES